MYAGNIYRSNASSHSLFSSGLCFKLGHIRMLKNSFEKRKEKKHQIYPFLIPGKTASDASTVESMEKVTSQLATTLMNDMLANTHRTTNIYIHSFIYIQATQPYGWDGGWGKE
jgi:hypothetical protein